MSKRRKLIIGTLVTILVLGVFTFIIFPPGLAHEQSFLEPIILYYDYKNLPFPLSQFPQIVNTDFGALLQHFDAPRLHGSQTNLQFLDHPVLSLIFLFEKPHSRPEYYIESLSDDINVSGLRWINLDMERISPNLQRFFYARTSAQGVQKISVTFPYGQSVEFSPSINIAETYSGSPWFWLMQTHLLSLQPHLLGWRLVVA